MSEGPAFSLENINTIHNPSQDDSYAPAEAAQDAQDSQTVGGVKFEGEHFVPEPAIAHHEPLVGPPPATPHEVAEAYHGAQVGSGHEADASYIDSLANWRREQGRSPASEEDWKEVETGADQLKSGAVSINGEPPIDTPQYTHEDVPFGQEFERVRSVDNNGTAEDQKATTATPAQSFSDTIRHWEGHPPVTGYYATDQEQLVALDKLNQSIRARHEDTARPPLPVPDYHPPTEPSHPAPTHPEHSAPAPSYIDDRLQQQLEEAYNLGNGYVAFTQEAERRSRAEHPNASPAERNADVTRIRDAMSEEFDQKRLGEYSPTSNAPGTEPATTPLPAGVNTLLDRMGYPNGGPTAPASSESLTYHPPTEPQATDDEGLDAHDRAIRDQLNRLAQAIGNPTEQARFKDAIEGVFAHRSYARKGLEDFAAQLQNNDPRAQSRINRTVSDIFRERNPAAQVNSDQAATEASKYLGEAKNRINAEYRSDMEISDALINRLTNTDLLHPPSDQEIRDYIRAHTAPDKLGDAFNPQALEDAKKKVAELKALKLSQELESIGNSQKWEQLVESRFQAIIKGEGPSADQLITDAVAQDLTAGTPEPQPQTVAEQKGIFGRFLDRIRGTGSRGEKIADFTEGAVQLPRNLWEQIPPENREQAKKFIQKSQQLGIKSLKSLGQFTATHTVGSEKAMYLAGAATGATVSALSFLKVDGQTQAAVLGDLQNTAEMFGITVLANGLNNERKFNGPSVKIASFAKGASMTARLGMYVAAIRAGGQLGADVASGLEHNLAAHDPSNIIEYPTPGDSTPHNIIVGREPGSENGVGGSAQPNLSPEAQASADHEHRLEGFNFTVHGPYSDATGTHNDNAWHEVQTSFEPGGSYADTVGTHWEAPSGVTKEDIMTDTYEKLMAQYGHSLHPLDEGTTINMNQLPVDQRVNIAHALAMIGDTNSYAEYQQIENQLGLAS